jgi:arginine/ornithine transport system substrate-binding protein
VAGRIDVMLADSIALDEGFIKTDAGQGFDFIGPRPTDPRWFGDGAGIAIRKGEDDLRQRLNAAIAAIREKGVYDEIQARYFDFDIYGED